MESRDDGEGFDAKPRGASVNKQSAYDVLADRLEV